jgi:hypothetical protein
MSSAEYKVLLAKRKAGCQLVDPWPDSPPKKRLRQLAGKLNKLESEWLNCLKRMLPADTRIYAQSWRVRIANGAWFKVDFCAFVDGRWRAWEVKGPKQGKNVDRGILALKCAATTYPEVQWILVWKEKGQWMEQVILP